MSVSRELGSAKLFNFAYKTISNTLETKEKDIKPLNSKDKDTLFGAQFKTNNYSAFLLNPATDLTEQKIGVSVGTTLLSESLNWVKQLQEAENKQDNEPIFIIPLTESHRKLWKEHRQHWTFLVIQGNQCHFCDPKGDHDPSSKAYSIQPIRDTISQTTYKLATEYYADWQEVLDDTYCGYFIVGLMKNLLSYHNQHPTESIALTEEIFGKKEKSKTLVEEYESSNPNQLCEVLKSLPHYRNDKNISGQEDNIIILDEEEEQPEPKPNFLISLAKGIYEHRWAILKVLLITAFIVGLIYSCGALSVAIPVLLGSAAPGVTMSAAIGAGLSTFSTVGAAFGVSGAAATTLGATLGVTANVATVLSGFTFLSTGALLFSSVAYRFRQSIEAGLKKLFCCFGDSSNNKSRNTQTEPVSPVSIDQDSDFPSTDSQVNRRLSQENAIDKDEPVQPNPTDHTVPSTAAANKQGNFVASLLEETEENRQTDYLTNGSRLST